MGLNLISCLPLDFADDLLSLQTKTSLLVVNEAFCIQARTPIRVWGAWRNLGTIPIHCKWNQFGLNGARM